MAAPSGTVWGSIAGGYGRIGIYVSLSNTNTQTTASIQVWLWTKWSCVDENNSYYFNNNATSATTKIGSININHQIASGTEWDTRNQTMLGSSTYTYDRGTSNKTVSCAALLKSVDRVGAQMTVSTSYTIPAKTSYAIAYNANGGTGAPSSQTKWIGESVTISSVKPTRTGYKFLGWATSSTATSANATYAAGKTYSSDANLTLYAVWQINTYPITYDANGGTGAPSSQTKTHNTPLTLRTAVPTRTNYTFKGWGTSATSTTVAYAPGASYTQNAAVKLYAIWELAYIEPSIYNYTVARCTIDGAELPTGTYALIRFNWKTTYANPSLSISWSSASAASGSESGITLSGTSGSVSRRIGGALASDAAYTITVTITDSLDSNSSSTTLGGSKFPIDFLPGGRGVGIGKPAELAGVADFALAAKFNGPVFGNVLGLNKLPEIPVNSDLNDYMTTGAWAVYKNANAATIANIPTPFAGRLEVSSATGEGIRPAQFSYLRQRYIPYNADNAIWERDIVRGYDNVWVYHDWWRSSLNPEASARVYKTPTILWSGAYYMRDTQTATFTGGKVSEQNNGIVLVFSQYTNNAAADSWWNSFFVPKDLVSRHKGTGQCFFMVGKASTSLDAVGMKYLYIHDDYIAGHATNDAAATGSGITYANNKFVLRYVIGV